MVLVTYRMRAELKVSTKSVSVKSLEGLERPTVFFWV